MFAARFGHVAVVKLLLEHHAPVDRRTYVRVRMILELESKNTCISGWCCMDDLFRINR